MKSRRGALLSLSSAFVLASVAGISAHFVRGLESPDVAAFVSSPTGATDVPIKLAWTAGTTTIDTGLSVACFYVANSSAERADRPEWPRITGVGFELPGSPTGFALVSPAGGDWEIKENVPTQLAGQDVTLDFVIAARVNPTGRTPGQPQSPLGIPPGQPEQRRSGTQFCVSGPFPQGLTIEGMINGVVVQFQGATGNEPGIESGVWFPTPAGTTGPGPLPRAIPLY